MVLSPAALREALSHFFHIIETFCGRQDRNESKVKILNFWEKRSIKISILDQINLLETANIPIPVNEDHKFEFQLNRHAIKQWETSEGVEERLLAHCQYILKYAAEIQGDREVRNKLWRFDEHSYIYWPKKDRSNLSRSEKERAFI